MRAGTQTYMYELVESVRKIAEGAAQMTGATLDFSFPEEASWDMITNYTLARALKKNIDEVGWTAGSESRGGHRFHRLGKCQLCGSLCRNELSDCTGACTWHSQDVVDAADPTTDMPTPF